MNIAKKLVKKYLTGGVVQPLLGLRDEDFQDKSKRNEIINTPTEEVIPDVNKSKQKVKGLRKIGLAALGFKDTGEENKWGSVITKLGIGGMGAGQAMGRQVGAKMLTGSKYKEVGTNVQQEGMVDYMQGSSEGLGNQVAMMGSVAGSYFGGPAGGAIGGALSGPAGEEVSSGFAKQANKMEQQRMEYIENKIAEDKKWGRGYGASITASDKEWYEKMKKGENRTTSGLDNQIFSKIGTGGAIAAGGALGGMANTGGGSVPDAPSGGGAGTAGSPGVNLSNYSGSSGGGGVGIATPSGMAPPVIGQKNGGLVSKYADGGKVKKKEYAGKAIARGKELQQGSVSDLRTKDLYNEWEVDAPVNKIPNIGLASNLKNNVKKDIEPLNLPYEMPEKTTKNKYQLEAENEKDYKQPTAYEIWKDKVLGGKKYELAKGGQIKGPGTGTSDSVKATLPEGSFVVTAKNAEKAKKYKEMLGGNPEEKAKLNEGGVASKVSNGEYLFTPQETQKLLSMGVDIHKEFAPNAEPENRAYNKGGLVSKFSKGGKAKDDWMKGDDIPDTKAEQSEMNAQYRGLSNTNYSTLKDKPIDDLLDLSNEPYAKMPKNIKAKVTKEKFNSMSPEQKIQLLGASQLAYGLYKQGKRALLKEPDLPMFDKNQLKALETYKIGQDYKEDLGRAKQRSTQGFTEEQKAQFRRDIDTGIASSKQAMEVAGAGNMQRALVGRSNALEDMLIADAAQKIQNEREYGNKLSYFENLRDREVGSENIARLKSDADAKYIDERNTLTKYEKEMDKYQRMYNELSQEANALQGAGFKNIEGGLASNMTKKTYADIFKEKYGKDMNEVRAAKGGLINKIGGRYGR